MAEKFALTFLLILVFNVLILIGLDKGNNKHLESPFIKMMAFSFVGFFISIICMVWGL